MIRIEGTSSKCRRDLINNEIQKLRDMLPLHDTVKSRLSYLHIMSLTCSYIRKGNFFNTGFKIPNNLISLVPMLDFTQAVNGFLMVVKCDGKLIYVSENVTDYLGHSMIELLATGGDIYSVIDSRDHDVIYNHLSKNAFQQNDFSGDNEISFVCRMNTARNMRRNDTTLKNKKILMRGRYSPYFCNTQRHSDRALMLTCLPIECWSFGTDDEMAPYNTETFCMLHSLDMKILKASPSVFFYTGYNEHELEGISWYRLVHHEDLNIARSLHLKMVRCSGGTKKSSALIRLLSTCGAHRYASVTIRNAGETGTSTHFITEHHIIRPSEVEFYVNEVSSNNVEITEPEFTTENISESATVLVSTTFDDTMCEDDLDKSATQRETFLSNGGPVPNSLDLLYDRIPCIECEGASDVATDEIRRHSDYVTESSTTYKPFEALKSAAKLLVCDRLKRDVDKFRIPYSHAMEIIDSLDQSDCIPQQETTNQEMAFLNDVMTSLPVSYTCSSHDTVGGYVQVTCQSHVTMGINGQVQRSGNW